MGTISLLIVATIFAFKSNTWDKIALNKNVEGKVESMSQPNELQVGEEGTAISRLAPMGKVLIKEKIYEARSEIGYVDENTAIVVKKIAFNSIIVEPLKQTNT